MIVYGDPVFSSTLSRELQRLAETFARPAGEPADLLRAALVHAGQVEQAAADAGHPDLPLLEKLTDRLAAALLGESDEVEAALRAAAGAADVPLRLTIPEGPAFYALYPEQYAEAARRWLALHPRPGAVLVVGLRSVGTTFSAVVQAVLRGGGVATRRATTRPEGHPFERRVELPRELAEGITWALVVDEGPGLSGSSMAATARELERLGIPPERIAFFPGHAGEPGSSAPGWVRERWSITPRWVVSPDELQWNGGSLAEALAARTVARLGGEVAGVDDLGGGLWRRHVPGAAAIPATVPFEAPKLRVRLRDGRAVLWKFAGLAAEGSGIPAAQAALDRLTRLAQDGWTARPQEAFLGWVATPWCDGSPLRRGDGNRLLLAHVGRYVAAAAGPPLDEEEETAARERLAHMLYWNTWEALGQEAAARAREWSERIAGRHPTGLPRYGDGRLAPHEWRRLPGGEPVKVDAAGHDRDHTCIGPQPFLWDVAGALAEWEPAPPGESVLLQAAGAAELPPELLDYYRLAYATFRLGLHHLCAAQATGPDRTLHEEEVARHRAALVSRL